MIRPARPGEAPAIDAFLARHAESSMFLRSNLAAHGLSGSEHRNATRFWVAPAEGEIRAVFGRTSAGFLVLQAPDAPDAWHRAFVAALGDNTIAALTGEARQTEATLAALGLPDTAWRLNHSEPLYRLALDTLPASSASIRPPVEADIPLLAHWFLDYTASTGISSRDEAAQVTALKRAVESVPLGQVRLLIEDGAPVAMSAVNARLPAMVQIGGVYVPPELRSRGRGGAVVAAQLLEERARGVRDAVLFANNDAAARAYERIGFARVGSYRVAVLERQVTPGVAA
ncbi:putative acetyltransferase [Citreicella sp. SE45]|nr:putative acetyltransferase [Citreicella sp. SE45]